MSYKKQLASIPVKVEDYRALIRAVNSRTSWRYAGLFSFEPKIRKGRVFRLPEGYLAVSKERELPEMRELGCIELIPFKLCRESGRVLLRINRHWLRGKAYSLSRYRGIYKPDESPYRLWRIWLYLAGRVIREVRAFLRVCKVEPEQKRAFNRRVKQEAELYLQRLPVKRSVAGRWLRYELRPKLLRVRAS